MGTLTKRVVKLDLANLKKLTSKQRTAFRKVVAAQAKDAQRRVKTHAPKDTGALKTSIGTKVQVTKQGVSAIIGPRTKYSKATKKGLKRPFKYAHFAEQNTQFLTKSLTKSDIQAIQQGCAREIEKLLSAPPAAA